MARRLLIVSAVFLAGAAPARADLVELNAGGAPLARLVGGTALAPEVGIWRVPAVSVPLLRQAGIVRLSERERRIRVESVAAATDPLVPTEWWRAAIGADRVEPPGPGKGVTVVDSGLDVTHPEFANRPNTVLMNPQTTSRGEEDHGTEVSSVLAAPNNGVGIVGVYPEVVLRAWDASPFGVLNEGSAIQGIAAAARAGPGVINLSFGGEDDDPLLYDVIAFAVRSGSLVVAAGGNEGQQGSPKGYPAAYPHVLTVGATNDAGRVAAFSTIAPTVDLVAPGVHIPVAEPLDQSSSGYIQAPGTSFAAPLVAGAAAWVWTTRPDLDNSQLFELMRRSATDIGEAGFDNASGYGLLNIPNALGFRTPARDLQEPNETPGQIEPHGLFLDGTAPVSVPGRPAASLTAHVDRSEDPLDLYRVWSPAHEILHVRAVGSVSVRVLRRQPLAETRAPLAVGQRGAAAYRNSGPSGAYVYIEIRPAGVRVAEYRLRITASRR